jgi:predicted nucleic acid-binding protein
MSMARILLDTNVLIYFYDHHSPEKQARARSLITQLVPLGISSISAQSLAEFASSSRR